MVLGQNMVILAGTWWYWVIKSWYCLALGGRGSVEGFIPVCNEKMPKIDTLDALEEHEEHEDDYQTNSN